jgi:hypothetical protein
MRYWLASITLHWVILALRRRHPGLRVFSDRRVMRLIVEFGANAIDKQCLSPVTSCTCDSLIDRV